MSAARGALALAEGGRIGEAIALIEGSGEGEAVALLGLWRLEGRLVPRDLAGARRAMSDAAEAGSVGAARMLTGFVAIGVGAEPDWPGAISLLDVWAGRDPMAARQRELIASMDLTDEGDPVLTPEGETLSESPHVIRFPALFTSDESALLADLAAPRFKPATIFHEGQGRFVADPVRRSDSAGFPVALETPFIHALNRRLAAASGTRVAQGESLQILRYRPGQEYRPHLDAVPGMANPRVLTMIVWLNDGYAGGATHFTETGLSVEGRCGDALLFHNMLPDGRPDPASRHEGCPVTRGEKLIASRWIRQKQPEVQGDFGPHEVARR